MQTEDTTRIDPSMFLEKIEDPELAGGWQVVGGSRYHEWNLGPFGALPLTHAEITHGGSWLKVVADTHELSLPLDDIIMPNLWTILIREPFTRYEQRKQTEIAHDSSGGNFREIPDIRVALKIEHPQLRQQIESDARELRFLQEEKQRMDSEHKEIRRMEQISKGLQKFVGETIADIDLKGETVVIDLESGSTVTFSFEMNDCEGGYCAAYATINDDSIRFDPDVL